MRPIYVTHVRSNVKRPIDVRFAFAHALVVGDNGAGKSAVINAIELALTGAAYDIAGRDEIKNLQMLRELRYDGAPEDEELFSEVTLSDGSKASWRVTNGQVVWEPPKNPVWFPFPEVEAALFSAKTHAGGHTRAVRWLYDTFAQEEDVNATAFPDVEGAVRDRFVDFVRQFKDKPRIERLPAAVDAANAAARAFKRDADTHTKAARVLREHASFVPQVIEHVESLCNEYEQAAGDAKAAADFGTLWMARIVQHLAPEVNVRLGRILPPGFTPYITVTDAHVKVGYAVDQQARIAPSGAQTVLLIAAFAALAATENRRTAVLALPDRYYSPNTLRALFALETLPLNIFIQAGTAPRGRPRVAWDVLNMGSWSYNDDGDGEAE